MQLIQTVIIDVSCKSKFSGYRAGYNSRKNEFVYQSFSLKWYVHLESVDSVQKNSFSENWYVAVPF